MPKFLNRYWVLGVNSCGTSREEPDLNIREHDVDHVRPHARRGQEKAGYEKPVYPEHRFQQFRKQFLDRPDPHYSRTNG